MLPLEPFRAVGQCLDGGGAVAERRFAVFPSFQVDQRRGRKVLLVIKTIAHRLIMIYLPDQPPAHPPAEKHIHIQIYKKCNVGVRTHRTWMPTFG